MTRVFKNAYNDWCAEDEFLVNGNRVIRITTMKRHNKSLATTVTAGVREGNCFTYTVFQDFSKTVAIAMPGRITHGAVAVQHASVISKIESIKTEVNEYYGQKKVAEAA